MFVKLINFRFPTGLLKNLTAHLFNSSFSFSSRLLFCFPSYSRRAGLTANGGGDLGRDERWVLNLRFFENFEITISFLFRISPHLGILGSLWATRRSFF